MHGAPVASPARSAAEPNGTPTDDALAARIFEAISHLHSRLLDVDDRDQLVSMGSETLRELLGPHQEVLLLRQTDGSHRQHRPSTVPAEAVDVLIELAGMWFASPTAEPVVVADTGNYRGLGESSRAAFQRADVASFVMAPVAMPNGGSCVVAVAFDRPDHPGLANVEAIRLAVQATLAAIRRVASLEALQRSESSFRDAAEANPSEFSILAPVLNDDGYMIDAEYVFTNAAARRALEKSCGDGDVSLYSIAFPNPARFTSGMERFRAALRRNERVESISRDDFPGAGERWIRSVVLPTAQGNLSVTVRDITIDIQAQRAVEEADERFQAAADANADAFLILEPDYASDGSVADYTIAHSNELARRTLLGNPESEMVRLRGVLGPDQFNQALAAHNEVLTSGQPADDVVTLGKSKEGLDETWYRRRLVAHGGRLLATYHDITAEKRAAEEAAALHGRLAAAAESNPDAFAILDPVRDESGAIVDFAVVFENEGAKSLRMQYNAPAQGRLMSELSDISPEGFERMLGEYVETLESGVPREDELVEDDLGERRWYLRRLLPLGGSIVAVYRDITERTLEMQSLARAEADKEAILASLSDLICVAEPDETGEFIITYANRAYLEFMGLEREQVIGRPRLEFQDPELGSLYDSVRTDAIESRQPLSRELQAEINGRTRHASVLVTPIFDETGACARVIWRVTDLTEEREAREESERAMANQRAVLDGLTDFVYLLDRDEDGEFRFSYANEAVYRRDNADALMGRRLQDMPSLEDGGAARIALLQRCVETRAPATGEFTLDMSGRRVVLDILATPLVDEDGEVTRVIWRASDVTGRRASERRFEAVATATTDPFSLLDPIYGPKGEVVDFSFRYSNETGKTFNRQYSGVETPARLSELFAPRPEGFPDELAIYVRVLETGEPYEAEVRTLDLAGNIHWLWRQLIPVEGGVVATGRDVTERKQQAEALANSEQIQRATLDGLSDSIVVNDRQPDGRFKTVVGNRAYARSFGLTLDQVLGRYPEDYLPAERIGPLAELSKQAVRRGEPMETELTVMEDGRTVHRFSRVIPIFNEEGLCIRTIWRSTDVTDLRAVERRFKASAEASIDSLMIFEPVAQDGTIVEFNIVYHNQRSRDRLAEWGRGLPTNLRELTQDNETLFAEALETYTAALTSGLPHSSKGPRQLNGKVRWYRRELVPVDNAIVATFRDVTDQQEERDALEEAEARQRDILDGLAAAVVVSDRDDDGNFPVSYANRAFFNLVGLEPADVYGRRARDFLTEQSNEVARAALIEAISTGRTTSREVTAHIGGREITAAALITPVLDDEGECIRVIWSLTDLTGQRVSEVRFKAAAEANLDGFMIMDPIRDVDGNLVDFDITFANAAARHSFHPTPDGSEVRTLRDMCLQDETRFSRALRRFKEALEKGEPSDEEVSSDASGQVRWYQRQLVPFGNSLIVTYREITRTKTARLELEAAERNQRAILEGLSDAVVVSDRDRNGDFPITYANPAFLELLGIPSEEIVDHNVPDFLPPELAELVYRTRLEAVEAGGPIERSIVGTVRGKELNLEARITPVFDSSGACDRIIWRLNDVSGARRRQEEAEAAERNLRTILENLTDGIIVSDRDETGAFRISYIHPVSAMVGRFEIDRMIGKTWAELYGPGIAAEREAIAARVMESMAPVDFDLVYPIDDAEVHLAGRASPVVNGRGAVERIIWRYTDVTEAYERQRDIERAERNQRAILEGLTDGIVVTDRDEAGDYRITYVHPLRALANVLSPERTMGRRMADLFSGEQLVTRESAAHQALTTGELANFETWSENEYGERIALSGCVTPVLSADGECRRLIWRFTDVTRAQRDAMALREAERNQSGIIEAVNDGLLVFDRDSAGDFRVIYSKPLSKLVPIVGDLVGQTLGEVWNGEVRAEREEIIRQALATGGPVDFETSVGGPGGETIFELARLTPVFNDEGECTRLIWRFTDITETYAQRRQLEAGERNQRAILDGIADDLYVLDRGEDGEFRFTYANETAIANYGAARTQGKRIDEAFGPEEAEPRLALLQRALETRRPQSTELTYTSEGRRQWLAMKASPVVASDGSCDRVIWRATDITERAEQQRLIEESERLQSAILGGLADFLYVFDRDPDGEFRYSYLNAAALDLSERRDPVPNPIGLRIEDVMRQEEAAVRNEMFDRAIRSRSAVAGEVSRVLNDGSVGWASTMVTPIVDEDGSCNRIIFRATNTTEARRRQLEIEENERNWRAILDALTDILVVMDRPDSDEPFRVSYVNATREAMTGRPDSQLMGKTIDEFLDPDGSRIGSAIDRAIEQNHYVDFEGTTTDRNGNPRVFSARVTPVYQPTGECRRVIVRYNDITLSRHTEQQLQQSEQNRKAIVDSLADIVLLLDADEQGEFRLSFANQPFFDTGRTPAETLGKRFVDFLSPDEAARRQAMFDDAIASGGPVEGEVSTEVNGRTIHFITCVTPILDDQGACVRSVWRYTDISELVHQRERLEASEREQRAVLDGLSDAIVVVDLQPDGRWVITRANNRHAEMIGQPPGSLHGLALGDIARTSSNAARSYALLQRALTARSIVEDESETTYSGREIIVATRVTPLFDEDGDCYRCIFRISDVTEVRQREAMVNRLGRAVDGASDEIYIINGSTFKIDQVNAGARANLGYSDEELASMTVIDVVVEPPLDELAALVAPLAMGEVGIVEMNATHRRKDGSTYPVEARLQVIKQNEVPVLVATVRDISLRQRMEESLARLAAIVESSADAVIGLDNDGVINHWNAAAASMFGHPETAARGNDLATVFASSEAGLPQLARIVRDGGSADVVLRRRDGNRVDVSATAFPVHAGDGNHLGTAIVARDIRWRVEATRALRESERRFRSIFDQAPEGILIQRADDGMILDVNQRLLDMIEWGREDLAGRRPIELGLVSDPEAVLELDRALNAGRSVAPQEMRVLTRKGRTIEVLVTVEVIELNGERCFLSFLSDISRLRNTERELLRAQESLRSITQNLPVILTSWDADDRCTFAAGLGLELAGLEGDALIGRHLHEIVGPSTQLDSAVETAHAGDSGSLEFSLAGRIYEAQYQVLLDRTTVSVAVDVTEVRTTTRQLETIVENMPITFLAFDADGIITICKGLAGGLLVSEASVGRSVLEVYESRPNVLPDLERVLAGERFSSSYTTDEGYALEVHYSPVRAAEGDLAGAAVVIIDVTDRLRAEQAVRETNERFRQMAETATDGIVSANRAGRIVFANVAMSTIFGYEPHELLGQSLTMLMPAELAGAHRNAFGRYLRTREKAVNWKSLELTGRRKDGTEFTIEMSLSEGVLDGEPVITAFIRDITERRRTEEALMQAQKLESLGVLAGGIAHDFNNMLVAIMGNAGLALAELPTESPARETVQEIELAARRAAELARQMLAYSGKGRLTVNTVDLTSLVEEIPHLLRTSIGKGVVLRYDLARDIPPVEADATQLRQVVMNLVINASDAIGDGEGVIAITTGSIEAGREQLRSAHIPGDLEPGLYCYLEVTDTGSGMSPDTLARIFDPFFTTKFTGKGLGLAAVLGIVRGHKGTIKVESTPGEGTTFRLLLPASHRAHGETAVLAPIQEQWKGSGTILVADDEDSVRHVTSRAVRSMGFEVIAAVDGQEACELFEANHENLAAVIMDLTMPRMNGETAAGFMRDLDPGVPIILMSGFDEGEMATRFRDAGIAEFVQKPFEIRTLRDAVRQAVGEPE